MRITEVKDKDTFHSIIYNELNNLGVLQNEKNRKEKKLKLQPSEKICRKPIFNTHIHLLELTDVFLANGSVVQIPKFIADACGYVLENVDTEGIFRKAGLLGRQRQIRINLEAGLPLGKSYHVIDVANVLKYFLRELPEPLIPYSMHEILLRSMVISENHIKAILMVILLIPPLTANTLAFFMQFLHTISLRVNYNKMSIENLAIIFTPGLMPFSNINSQRFSNHVKMIRLLIENAKDIGTIPDNITRKLQNDQEYNHDAQKKRRKRRSGSLSLMLNGFKKIVNSALGSSENLEEAVENKTVKTSTVLPPLDPSQQQYVSTTPYMKMTKKRKFTDPVCAFSAKKKKDLLALLPNNGFLPNTPLPKEQKKVRLSLCGNRQIKNLPTNSVIPTTMERRWSIVASGWPKNKPKKFSQSIEQIFNKKIDLEDGVDKVIPNVVKSSSETVVCAENKNEFELAKSLESNENSSDMFKNEYEEIKERVTALETRITQEFGDIRKSLLQCSSELVYPVVQIDSDLNGPERVQNKYEQIVVETEPLASPSTEDLTQRMRHNLRIRRSVENAIRSPSARKIGNIRRRSQDKRRLSRNQTWHISSKFKSELFNNNQIFSSIRHDSFRIKESCFTPMQTSKIDSPCKNNVENEQWTAGEIFFNEINFDKVSHNEELNLKINNDFTPVKCSDKNFTPVKKNNCALPKENFSTPMLPPKSIPTKVNLSRAQNINKNSAIRKAYFDRTSVSTPLSEESNGRASIAMLRTQNAGMVLAKAKLFDELSGNHNSDNGSEMGKMAENATGVNQQQISFKTTDSTHCNKKKEKYNPKNIKKSTQVSTNSKNNDKLMRNSKVLEENLTKSYIKNKAQTTGHIRSLKPTANSRTSKLCRESHANALSQTYNQGSERVLIREHTQIKRKSRQLFLK